MRACQIDRVADVVPGSAPKDGKYVYAVDDDYVQAPELVRARVVRRTRKYVYIEQVTTRSGLSFPFSIEGLFTPDRMFWTAAAAWAAYEKACRQAIANDRAMIVRYRQMLALAQRAKQRA